MSQRSNLQWRDVARAVALSVFGLGIGLACLLQKPKDWDEVYLRAALRLRAGENILRDGYAYPPFQAVLAAPFTYLPHTAARILWACTNAIAACVIISGAWRLSGGGSAPHGHTHDVRECSIFALGLAAAIGFLFDAVTNAQTDLILAALVIGGCWASADRKRVLGPVLIGLAAAGKCAPLLFAPWFALRRRWIPALTIFAVAIFANLVPDLVFPPATGGLRLAEWARTYLGAVLGRNYVPGTWATAIEFNHSLAGMLNRLLPASALRVTWAIVALALLVIAAITIYRSRSNRLSNSGTNDRFEIGMVLTSMLLLCPISSKPHFCVLLLPAWTIARAALTRRDRVLLTVAVLCAFCGLLSNKDLVGAQVYGVIKWYGVITFETLLLFGACAWARWQTLRCVATVDDGNEGTL